MCQGEVEKEERKGRNDMTKKKKGSLHRYIRACHTCHARLCLFPPHTRPLKLIDQTNLCHALFAGLLWQASSIWRNRIDVAGARCDPRARQPGSWPTPTFAVLLQTVPDYYIV